MVKIEWLKCPHGVLKTISCQLCDKELEHYKSLLNNKTKISAPPKIPIYRGCNNEGGCFCSGKCKEIIGYREPLYPGEK